MKKIIIAAIICLLTLSQAFAQDKAKSAAKVAYPVTLISDTTVNGIRQLTVQTNKRVCSKQIYVAVNKKNVIQEVKFTGGCSGNTQGVEKLCAGLKVKDALSKIEGIDCAGRGTSCPDQLSQALRMLL